MSDTLDALMASDPEELDQLRASLAERAERDGALDVGYRLVDSPIGTLLVASTQQGLVRLAFEREDHDGVLQELSDRVSPRVLRAPGRLDAVARQLDDYFGGGRQGFELTVDLRLAAGFRRSVLEQLRAIGYGQTKSYAQVATATGRPGAARAVGTACALNPVPIVVPCHRVVRADQTPGQYRGGPEAKVLLLALEKGRAG